MRKGPRNMECDGLLQRKFSGILSKFIKMYSDYKNKLFNIFLFNLLFIKETLIDSVEGRWTPIKII